MTKEQTIQKFMRNLGISREEAIQLMKDDENDVTAELTTEQKKVVKAMTQSDRKKETTPRKRERKIDTFKVTLIESFVTLLKANHFDIVNVKPESEIEFSVDGEEYSLRLIKHRGKKE